MSIESKLQSFHDVLYAIKRCYSSEHFNRIISQEEVVALEGGYSNLCFQGCVGSLEYINLR